MEDMMRYCVIRAVMDGTMTNSEGAAASASRSGSSRGSRRRSGKRAWQAVRDQYGELPGEKPVTPRPAEAVVRAGR